MVPAPPGAAFWRLLLLVAVFDSSARASICQREPEGHSAPRSNPVNRFAVRVSGNPTLYVPGETYTVSLVGARTNHVPLKFTGFQLVSESAPGEEDEGITSSASGQFTLTHDALTRFSERCPDMVTQTSSMPKSEVQVYWRAPGPGNGCVALRATVVEYRDVWYRDDGPLSVRLCPDMTSDAADPRRQPPVLDPCCACDEAKYELTFEGLWSRHTHPKDFPSNSWLTRYSDVIGASHTNNYRFWDYGGYASEGLREVAERGATRMLESELKARSDQIRTIIKARGVSYPNVTSKTFAVFRVDHKHHLVSFVSMIVPSPDWIVGVSGLELCLKNCSWVWSAELDLFPWDVGTDSGVTYTSEDSPTQPQDRIRAIRSNFPNDPESPFYDTTGREMKPMARLYLTRQRLYEKSCEGASEGELVGGEGEGAVATPELDALKPGCEVTSWGEWNSCSVTCGQGFRHRQRFYIDQIQADRILCSRPLTLRHNCYAPGAPVCPSSRSHEAGSCPLSEWGAWSQCSQVCGAGHRTRFRRYKSRQENKICSTLPNAQPLQETQPCHDVGGPDKCSENKLSADPECAMSPWSEWSPCHHTCQTGITIRTRQPLDRNCPLPTSEQAECNEGVPCEEKENENNNEASVEVCSLEKDPGPCRNPVMRYYFDTHREACHIFTYGSCNGNANNFKTKEECEERCKDYKAPSGSEEKNSMLGNIEILDSRRDPPLGLDSPPEKMSVEDLFTSAPGLEVDCKVSKWSSWSACSEECIKTMHRTILIEAMNGGHPCPTKLRRVRKCKSHACKSQSGRNSNEETFPTWGEADAEKSLDPGGCQMSLWSSWSSCSMTCGDYSMQQRSRYIVRTGSSGPHACPSRVEIRRCPRLPCKD